MSATRMYLTGDDKADALLASDGNALLIGMVLDQQVPMDKAFSGPAVIAERMGGDLDVAAVLRQVYDRNPGALLAGTDLPCTRSPRPVVAADLRLLRDAFDDHELAQVVQHNAASLYRTRPA